MKIKRLIPSVYYTELESTMSFYVDKLGFTLIHQEGDPISMALAQRDAAEFQLWRHSGPDLPVAPSFRMYVDDVQSYYNEIVNRDDSILHPNVKTLVDRPWGTTEFSVLDKHKVGITIFTPTDMLKA